MIDIMMFVALGFLLGCLLALILAPPLWNRAVKLTTRKLEATMPMSLGDIQADKDQLRAEFAIELRKVEVALDRAKDKAARELIEANKRRVEIQVMETELAKAKGSLQENENANRVLQQTIRRRLPDLDSRLKAAKKALAELESVNAELRTTVASQSEALKTARSTLHSQRTDIDRLRAALESGGGASVRGMGKGDARTQQENQRLTAELSRTQEELERVRMSAEESAFLRRELTRLSAQILNAVRNQGAYPQPQPQPRTMLEVPQSFGEYDVPEEPQEPEPVWHPAHGGNGNGREPEAVETAIEVAVAQAEMHHTEVEDYEGHVPAEEPATPPEEDEQVADEPAERRGFARRFAARREQRRARKGGGSLSDRLRGLVGEAPESRS